MHRNFSVGMLRVPVILLVAVLLVGFTSTVLAQVDASSVGKFLMMTRDGVQLRAQDPATGQTRVIGTVTEAEVRLDKIQGNWLWVRTPTQEGWITRDDAIPSDQAISYFTGRIQRNPSDAYAYNQRSNAWAERHDLDKAMADINEAIRLMPSNAVLRHNRGVIWYEKGDFDKAVADYDETLRLDAQYPLAYCHRGETFYALGQYDKALSDYGEAIRLLPGYAVAYADRGWAWLAKKEYQIASADFGEAIRYDAKLWGAYRGRAQCYHYLGQHDEALSNYDRALALQPDSGLLYSDRGSLWYDKQQYANAIRDFDEALRRDSNNGFALNRRGQSHYFLKQYDQAMADYNAALRQYPAWAELYNNRGWLWCDQQQYDQAMHDFNEAIRLDANFSYAYRGRARCYKARKDYDRALADCEEVIRGKPNWAVGYFERGEIWFGKKDYDRAVDDYSAALRLDAKYAAAYTSRAVAWRVKRDFQRALADTNEAVRLAPETWTPIFQRANTYRSMGEYPRAIADYNEAMRLNPSDAGIVATRGYTYYRNKQYDKALADFDQAEKINPSQGWAYRNRALLLATCPDDKYRDGAKARQQLAKAEELMTPAADLYEAQAAVAAENGDFDDAVRWQQRVLEDPAWRNIPDMQARLEVYRNKQAYREGMVMAGYTPQVPVVPAPPEPAVPPTPPAGSAPTPAEADIALLRGTWTCVLTIKNGEPVDDYLGVRAVIEGDNLTWFFPQPDGGYREQQNKFRIDPTQDPKHFDWWPVDKPESVDMRIYSLSENTLRMATNLDGKTRPASFDAARWQFTVKRVVTAAETKPDTPGPGEPVGNEQTKVDTEPQQASPGGSAVIDPLKDCQIGERAGNVSFIVPGKYHDLVSFTTWRNADAPRIVTSVRGDFTVQVLARRFAMPFPKTPANPDNPFSYVSTGLLVWQDDDNFLRLQRAANGDSGRAFIHANMFSAKDMIANSSAKLDDEDVYLRVQRKDGQFTQSYSTDGKAWTEIRPEGKDLVLGNNVQVGVFVINATTREITHEFADLKITSSTTH